MARRLPLLLGWVALLGGQACEIEPRLTPPQPSLQFDPPDLTTNLGSPSSCDPQFSPAGCPGGGQLGAQIGIFVGVSGGLSDAGILALQQSLSLEYWPDGGPIPSEASGLLTTQGSALAMAITPLVELDAASWVAMVFRPSPGTPFQVVASCIPGGAGDAGQYLSRFRVESYPLLLGVGFGDGDAAAYFSESMSQDGGPDAGLPPASGYGLATAQGACARAPLGVGWDTPVYWSEEWDCPGETGTQAVTFQASGPIVASSGLAVRLFDGGALPPALVFSPASALPGCGFTSL